MMHPAPSDEITSRTVESDYGDGVSVSLSHYLAGTAHGLHRHDFTQISFLLAGALLERLEGKEREMHGPALGVKPAGTLHEDLWGPSGTLIFSIKICSGASALTMPALHPHWAGLSSTSTVRGLVASCFAADQQDLGLEAVHDLLALVGGTSTEDKVQAPQWLERARCQIHDAPDHIGLEEVAGEAGVDRAHLSRMFKRCFGLPPSAYRQQVLAARAVGAIADSSVAFSEAALDSGYGDQAHMNRAVKAHTGITPGRLRRLLRN
jgi:AraC family transcriptional regulator